MGIPHARERIVGGLYFGIPRFVCSRYCQSYSLHAVFEICERINRHTHRHTDTLVTIIQPPGKEVIRVQNISGILTTDARVSVLRAVQTTHGRADRCIV